MKIRVVCFLNTSSSRIKNSPANSLPNYLGKFYIFYFLRKKYRWEITLNTQNQNRQYQLFILDSIIAALRFLYAFIFQSLWFRVYSYVIEKSRITKLVSNED